MAGKEGSVAPRERINIRYVADTKGMEEEVELPFRILVMGDFTGRPDDSPIEQREAVAVDKDNFEDVLAAQDVEANLSVPDEIGDVPDKEIGVSLKFKKMRDFTPDAICQQVPELKKLVDLRDALTSLKGPLGNIPAFRRRLEAILDDPESQRRLLEELGGGGKKGKEG